MRTNVLSKKSLLITLFLGFVIMAVLAWLFYTQDPIRDNPVLLVEDVSAVSIQEQITFGLPAHIRIPAIDVDTNIIPVGLTSDGAMDVPKGPSEVGWWNVGPRPGEVGSSVVTGHYDWYKNEPAVFDYLHDVKVGDKITVEDEHGTSTTFVVRETRIFGKDDTAEDVFFSNDGKAHLNLITCTGTWNKAEKTFSDRLVVFADKE